MGVVSPFENAGREPGDNRLDASKTIFVDDIAAAVAVDKCEFVQPTIETLNDTLDDHFEEYGFLQNADKAAALVHLCGDGTRYEQ